MLLNNWSFTRRTASPFHAPETGVLAAQGTVDGHSRLGRGGDIITSAIDRIEGKNVYTVSGSCYTLGTVDPKFKEYMEENYPGWDENNPRVF